MTASSSFRGSQRMTTAKLRLTSGRIRQHVAKGEVLVTVRISYTSSSEKGTLRINMGWGIPTIRRTSTGLGVPISPLGCYSPPTPMEAEQTATGAVIEFRNVRKVHAQGRRDVVALDGVSLRIGSREFVTIMGPSGSGKSTLLHLTNNLNMPTSGK